MTKDFFTVIDNKYLADGMNFISKEKYNHYINNNGEHVYNFPKNKKVIIAYNEMLRLRRELNE